MRPKDWIKAARRRCSADLFLCRNPLQAGMVKVHPECYLIWDRAPDSHEPYFVLAIHASGLPRDPSDFDIDILQGMASDREHQGRRGWIADIDRGAQDRFDTAEEEYKQRVHDHFSPGGHGYESVRRYGRQKLVIAKTIPKNQAHLGRKRILKYGVD